MKSKPKRGHYRAKTLAIAAGISTNLLRAWERRYDIFDPEREPGGHRLYTEDDLTVLRRLRELTQAGLSISEAVALGRKALLERHQSVFSEHHHPSIPLSPLEPELQAVICELAPCDLAPRRSDRYAGEELGVSLSLLHPSDLSLVYRVYQTLKSVYEVWIYMEQQTVRPILLGRLKDLFEGALKADLQLLGAATGSPHKRLQSALEDSRSGALAFLLDYCRGRSLETFTDPDLHVLITLARDHAKMMRNSFYDLDPVVREADESLKAHSLRPMLQKLQACYSGRVDFRAGTNYEGPISSRCLETSALDRVLYQMLARCIDPQREGGALWVTPINDRLCRWAFQCSSEKVSLPDADDLPVQATAMAMGVSADEVLSFAYLGSARRSGRLWAWFHWPIYHPPTGVPHCRCEPLGLSP